MNYIEQKMNFDVNFCNSCGGKMKRVAFYVLQGSVATLLMRARREA